MSIVRVKMPVFMMLAMFLFQSLYFHEEILIVMVTATIPSVTSMCIGRYFGCASLNNGKAKCWGNDICWGQQIGNYDDAVGDNVTEIGDALPYISVSEGTSSIEKLFCGACQVCVKFDSGTLKCLGLNGSGQAGAGVSTRQVGERAGNSGDGVPATLLGTGIHALDVAASGWSTCVLVTGNQVKCFGWNYYGQLGYGDTVDRGSSPSDMGNQLPFVDFGTDIEVASVHTGSFSDNNCVVLSAPSNAAQRIKCWGKNNRYQLGYGDTNHRGDGSDEMGDNLPLIDLGSESKVKQLAMGAVHICAILVSDALKCWGLGQNGQLASGSPDDIIEPGDAIPFVLIDSGKTVKRISVGEEHTCILYSDDVTLKCVGFNSNGQLGLGDAYNRGNTLDTRFPNISAIELGLGSQKIMAVYASYYNTCVFLDNFTIKCWGNNFYAQLGFGAKNNIGVNPNEMGANLNSVQLFSPTDAPTVAPTRTPTKSPATVTPTHSPTINPTTAAPIATNAPNSSSAPTSKSPSKTPTQSPTKSPTTPTAPTQPTLQPSKAPTKTPTFAPKNTPTKAPTKETGNNAITNSKSSQKVVVGWLLIVATMIFF